jgi:DNA invertase Pin-like site-specific DNA recombinase
MGADRRPVRRCAIYTRKSSEEGLEQDFNSLDAQREACEAYIRSQAGEGWKPVRSSYDDGGYSGGSMDRPALTQLLSDIRARKLDTVVVYKVDRLTRSLADFAKIVEVFDTHGVSFVSVTQQFNTTTSMGRLTLNMLLSFAQFEREVTGERIRDKIAASKRKGMWMGGFVPLGYQPNGRTLVIHEPEAETVRAVFRLYLEHGNVRRVKEEADRLGLATKVRESALGRMCGGKPLGRSWIYNLLRNPLYVGRIAHKGETYEGQHPPIIDTETWETVQARLSANAHERLSGANFAERSLLAGKLFDETGVSLVPSHTVKSGRRYRYYVSRDRIAASAESSGKPKKGWRLPAREIERLVGDGVTTLLADRGALSRLAREAEIDAKRVPELLHAARDWTGAPLDLVKRVELGQDEIAIRVNLSLFLREEITPVRHTIRTQIRRRGVEVRLVIDDGQQRSRPARPDPALVKAVVRAHKWFGDLVSGRVQSFGDIAKAEGVTRRYVRAVVPLAFLAPDIVARILSGSQPVDLTAEKLVKRTDLRLGWSEQKALLGFEEND